MAKPLIHPSDIEVEEDDGLTDEGRAKQPSKQVDIIFSPSILSLITSLYSNFNFREAKADWPQLS